MTKKLFVTGIAATAILGVWAGCSGSTSTGGATGSGGASSSSHSSSGATSGAGGGGTGGSAIDIKCNPVTNASCPATTACDTATDGSGNLNGFSCYAGPNTVADCGSCDPTGANSPFCSPGSTCFAIDQAGDGQCAHYCCTDADCGPGGGCATVDTSNMPLFGPVSTTLGVCVAMSSGDAGAGDAGDAGTGDAGAADAGAASIFACDAPAASPSNGSCITLTP